MSDKNDQQPNELIDKAYRALSKQKLENAIDYGVNHPNYYESLKTSLDIITDDKQRNLLKELAKQIYDMRDDDETRMNIALIKLYRNISHALDKKLVPKVSKRFKRILKKDVKFVFMKNPENGDIREIGDMAMGAAANMQSLRDSDDPGEKEALLNEYLMEILDYRLASLPDEAAWDFVAQSILAESKELR